MALYAEQEMSDVNVIKEGWLMLKKKGDRSWHRKYFRLTPTALSYSKDDLSRDVRGEIVLAHATTFRSYSKKSYSFEIKFSPNNQAWYLQAKSDDQCQLWLTDIRKTAVFDVGIDKHDEVHAMTDHVDEHAREQKREVKPIEEGQNDDFVANEQLKDAQLEKEWQAFL
jgi:PH domain